MASVIHKGITNCRVCGRELTKKQKCHGHAHCSRLCGMVSMKTTSEFYMGHRGFVRAALWGPMAKDLRLSRVAR